MLNNNSIIKHYYFELSYLMHRVFLRHKTNAIYGNLVSDKVDKKVIKNLFYGSLIAYMGRPNDKRSIKNEKNCK